MMNECFAKQLGGPLGRYIKMHSRYPRYLCVRVDYPLQKALQPSLMMRIKGREVMVIALRYENVPHFYFQCGCMGHVAVNCEEGEPDDHSVRYGEELRVSPPRRVWEINVQKGHC
jgi:hypothetical protein